MKTKMLALLMVALVAVVSSAVAVATGMGQAAQHANHPTGPPTTVPCTFDHPASLPAQASPNATAALAARSTHCPPSTPSQ